jgi:hypothetical protein
MIDKLDILINHLRENNLSEIAATELEIVKRDYVKLLEENRELNKRLYETR